MPHLAYQYHAPGGIANCAAVAGLAPGNPAPNLVGLAGTAGGALPGFGIAPLWALGFGGAGLGGVAGLAGCVPYIWAGITNSCLLVGRYPPGVHPAYEANWRISTFRVAAFTQLGRLRVGPLADNLDTTERRTLSYHMGMSLAAYVSQIANLGLPMHFSRYAAVHGGLGVAYTLNGAFAAANLPDLVFVDVGNATCQIWEAKGRLGARGGGYAPGGVPARLNAAMAQARKIATLFVPGAGLVAPNAYISSVARVGNGANRRWHLHIADPASPQPPQQSGSSPEKDAFYAEFYRPFVLMVLGGSTERVGPITYLVQRLGSNVRVGVDERIVRLLRTVVGRTIRGGPRPTPLGGNLSQQIEGFLAAGYPQDRTKADRFINRFGILTDAPDDDIAQPPS